MKLAEHVEHIRQLIDTAFRNRLGRMGITSTGLKPLDIIPSEYLTDRKRIESIFEVLIAETGSVADAYEKLVEEFTFTLFNRIAALKVMEAHTLHSEIVTRRSQHGDRSFAHKHWLEQNPGGRNEEMEGLVRFMEDQFESLAIEIPLFSLQHSYHLLPTLIELNNIITSFNQVEIDTQVETEIWKSDDVLGWLYESYNNVKKEKHKSSGNKIEFNNVSLRSQIYTPRWVVKFLVDNSLGKMYLEMYPGSDIKNRYKIANISKTQTRVPKSLTEIKLIDPATGSGNYLLYAFDLFYDLYNDQIENYGAKYDDRKIAELIISHNLYGVDLDDRAIQIAQLGLYIKAKRKKRSAKIEHFNVVSSDFFLPEYKEVKQLFEDGEPLAPELEKIVLDLWTDLQQAYKFGVLIRLEEKFSIRLHDLVQQFGQKQMRLFEEQTLANYDNFRNNFLANLQIAVDQHTARQGQTFLNTKTQDAITFLQLLTQKYDVAVANPPYADSSDFGPELKRFVEANYRQPYKFNSNLYASFIKRCCELTDETGYVALIHPHTFMFIKTFEDVRKYIIEHTHIELLVDYGLDRVNLFGPGILLDATWYVLSKQKKETEGIYFNITANQQERAKQASLEGAYSDFINNRKNDRVYSLAQSKLKIIEGWPFIYWISDEFRKKFKEKALDDELFIVTGLMTGNNDRFVRYKWEVDSYSKDYPIDSIKWVPYQKGGNFNRWYGNNWLVVNYESDGKLLATTDNKRFYFTEGITYSATSTKGVSFRKIDLNQIFDKKGSCLFLKGSTNNLRLNYFLALLNTKFVSYVSNSLNSTVETQVGDVKRVPFIQPTKDLENLISALASQNVEIKRFLCAYRITEPNFYKNPLTLFKDIALKGKLLSYLNYENAQLTLVLLNEAIIDKLIFEVYDLIDHDKQQVEAKMGKPVGALPVLEEARKVYLNEITIEHEIVKKHIDSLAVASFEEQQLQAVKAEFGSLYQSNNDLEEFCIRNQVCPK